MVSAHRISLEGRSDGQDSQILDALARTAYKGGVKMDRKEAILRIKDHMEHHGIGKYPHLKLKEAFDMSIAALDAPNEPLTLDELRQMDGEPVYIVFLPDATGEKLQFWALVDVDAFGDVNLTNNLDGSSPYEEAMANIEAIYRRPPEGEEDT